MAEAKVLPDGCPDLSGTYFCDSWSNYHNRQVGSHFQSFERIPDPDSTRNATIYKIEKYQPGREAEKGISINIADGKNYQNGKDFSRNSCENGTLKFYAEEDIYKVSASWYFKGDILVKKVYKEYRYSGRGILDQTYPCKSTDDPEAAAACNNHWCSWEMDQEKADCYKNLCQHSKTPEGCFNEKCRNDWSKPATPRSTVDLVN